MTSHDVFSTETAGLAEVSAPGVVRLHDGDRLSSASVQCARTSTAPSCGCSPTTARSPARPCTWSRGRRSPCRPATTATSRRPCTGTACGWRTATTGSRTRRRSRSRSAARTRCQVQFPDAGFYWYHPHIREDFAQEMGLYGTIIVEPTDPAYWPAVDRQLTLTLDDLLVEDGQIAPFHRSGPNFTAMGRFGNVLLINGETAFSGEASVRRGRPPVPGQYRQHADLQLRRPRRTGEAGRRRQRPVRARDVRRGGAARPVGAGHPRRALRHPRRGAARASNPGPGLRPGGIHGRDGRRRAAAAAASFEVLRTDPELTAEHRRHRSTISTERRTRSSPSSPGCRSCTATTTRRRPSYACPMHPEVTASEPATCPQCGMKLVPVTGAGRVLLRLPDAPQVTASEPGDVPAVRDEAGALRRAAAPLRRRRRARRAAATTTATVWSGRT